MDDRRGRVKRWENPATVYTSRDQRTGEIHRLTRRPPGMPPLHGSGTERIRAQVEETLGEKLRRIEERLRRMFG